MDPVLHPVLYADQEGPKAQQFPQLTHGRGGAVGLGDQVGPQQLGQGTGIHLIGF